MFLRGRAKGRHHLPEDAEGTPIVIAEEAAGHIIICQQGEF